MMQTKRILWIGLSEALKSPHVEKLRADFERAGSCEFASATLPESNENNKGPVSGVSPESFDVWIFVATGYTGPDYNIWKEYYDRLESKPQTAALAMKALPASVMTSLKIENLLLLSESSQKFVNNILQGAASISSPTQLTNRKATVSRTKMDVEDFSNALEELVTGLDEEVSKSGLSKIEDPAAQRPKPGTAEADPSAMLDAGFEIASSPTSQESKILKLPDAVTSAELKDSQTNALAMETAFDQKGSESQLSLSAVDDPKSADAEFSGQFSGAHLAVSEATKAPSQLSTQLKPMPEDFDDDSKTSILKVKAAEVDLGFALDSADVAPGPVASHDLSKNTKQNLEKNTAIVEPNWAADLQVNGMKPLAGETETLQRYAALKEREAREREATLQVLTKQLAQVKEKLHRSEEERRRLQLSLEDARVLISTLEQFKEQTQVQTRKVEQQHQERLRALQLKLDSAQFSANRSERKLEEFRERVRNDILRIRLRERELANKLELQKRDAESLLTAKDERLLAQKRELDRLEFEMEMLKERMIDETQKAEERAEKLSKALKSLRMAQGMLSGIEEEVIPTAENRSIDDSSGEDAA